MMKSNRLTVFLFALFFYYYFIITFFYFYFFLLEDVFPFLSFLIFVCSFSVTLCLYILRKKDYLTGQVVCQISYCEHTFFLGRFRVVAAFHHLPRSVSYFQLIKSSLCD